VATPARDVPIVGDQLALFGVLAGDLSEAMVPTDLSPRANGRPPSLTLGEAARIIREAVKDKSDCELGEDRLVVAQRLDRRAVLVPEPADEVRDLETDRRRPVGRSAARGAR
jgi:hypothetical protein